METPSGAGTPQAGVPGTPNGAAASADIPKRWREERRIDQHVPPAPGAGSRRARIFLSLAVMLALLGAVGGILSWLGPPPNAYFVPLFITEHQSRAIPFVPMAQPDAAGLAKSGLFPRYSPLAASRQEGHALLQELANLKTLEEHDTVVVYLCAHAVRDAQGRLCILPADALPDSPHTWLLLKDVLEKLRDCPARNQLLVLDLMRASFLPRLGAIYHDVPGAIPAELQAVPDARRLVLTPCAAGQRAHLSEELGRSVFSYYFEEGLRGYAEACHVPARRDGRITVRALAAFVRARVDRWAIRNRAARQTPVLYGTAPDFALVALDHGEPREHVALPAAAKYPAWLLESWKQRDAWWTSGDFRRAPRPFMQAQALLLAMEKDWRGGQPEARLQQYHLSLFERARSEMARQLGLVHPQAVSLAQEAQAGARAAPEVKKAVEEMMDRLARDLAEAKAAAKAEEAEKIRAKALDDFRAKVKPKTDHDLDEAVVTWAVQDGKHDPGVLRFLDQLLHPPSRPRPRYVETLALKQLADLVYRIEDKNWPAPQVRSFLHAVQQGEIALADADTFAWVRPLLEEACQARQDGALRLWARGYASLDDADKFLRLAETRFEAALAQAAKVRAAQQLLDETCALLPATAAFLEAVPAQHKHWSSAALLARDLAHLLSMPPAKGKMDGQSYQDKIEHVDRLARQLAEPVHELKKPFSKDNVQRLQKLAALPQEGASLLAALEAILSVAAPNLAAEDRLALWQTARQLGKRLNDETVQLDRDEDRTRSLPAQGELGQEAAERPAGEPDQGGATQTPSAAEGNQARRRAQSWLALLELGGFPAREVERVHALVQQLGRDDVRIADWCAVGQELRVLWALRLPALYQEESSPYQQVRLRWIAPPGDPIKGIDEASNTASALLRLQQAKDHWAWLGDHYRYLARDYQGLGLPGAGPDAARYFYSQAANANQDLVRLGPEVFVSIHSLQPIDRLASNQTSVSATLELVRHLPEGGYGPLDLRLVAPDPAWLQLTPDALRLPGVSSSPHTRQLTTKMPLKILLRPGAERSFLPRPLGFLAQAEFEGRAFHTLVSVPIQAVAQEVVVFLGPDPKNSELTVNELRLRPGKVPQAYFLFVKNLTPRSRKVALELLAGDMPVSLGSAGKTDGKLTVNLAPEETRVVNLGEMPIPKEGLPELKGPLVLLASDADTAILLDQKKLRIDVASPREYVRVTDIQYDPPGVLSPKSKLSVKLQTLSAQPGPNIPLELVLPEKRIPGLLGVEGGNLRGELLNKDHSPAVTLFAEGLRLAEGADEEGAFYLNVDGLDRAFLFKATFVRRGDSTTPRGDGRPQVRWNVGPFAAAGPQVVFPIEVDNAPSGSILEVSLGRGTPSSFEADLTRRFPTAKERRIGFWPQGPAGALLFEGSLKDWTVAWNTTGISGVRLLRARLLDDRGQEIAQAFHVVTLESTPPAVARIVDPPAKHQRGTPLQLAAQGNDPESGIASVTFFPGEPDDNKIPKGAATFPASALDSGKTSWATTITLPEDKKGKVVISAQFTNGIGLSKFDTVRIELVEKEDAKGPGKIRGTVTEGPRPQPGLEVILRDAKGKEKAKTRTQKDGSFLFENVPPGSYFLYCIKPESMRHASVPVTVEPNKTSTKNLELSL